MKRYRRQSSRRYASWGILAVSLIVGVMMIVRTLQRGQVGFALFFAVLCVIVLFARHLESWVARRSFRKSPYYGEDLTIEFTDAGFHARSPKQDVKLEWSAFTKVVQFSDGFLLFQGPRFYNWIPLSSLGDSSQATELAALLRSKVANYRAMGEINRTA